MPRLTSLAFSSTAVLLVLGACLPPPATAPVGGQCQAPPVAAFQRTATVDDMQFASTIGAVSRMLAANYTVDGENVYIANSAPPNCREARIVLATESITMVGDPDTVTAALEGGGKTGPWARDPECACLKDGALQEGVGMCKAQVYKTTEDVDIYQIATGANAGKIPYDKFWLPYDPRYIPTSPSGKLIKCNIPRGTVIAIGLRKNPNPAPAPPQTTTSPTDIAGPAPRPDEFMTYWFVGDTWGTWGNKERPPYSWKCVVTD